MGFVEDPQGIVWAATTGQAGLWRFDGTSWQNIKAEWNAPATRVGEVGFDRAGILWVLTESRGLEAKRELFFLPPGTRQFSIAGHFSVQGLTWDADRFVVTTPANSVQRNRASSSSGLPAYPFTKEFRAARRSANSVWAIPLEGPCCGVLWTQH
jgi:hypothetical protein